MTKLSSKQNILLYIYIYIAFKSYFKLNVKIKVRNYYFAIKNCRFKHYFEFARVNIDKKNFCRKIAAGYWRATRAPRTSKASMSHYLERGFLHDYKLMITRNFIIFNYTNSFRE